MEGLDRINKLRGINFCVDLSATPYYLGRVGQKTNQTFPWVVSDFGLTDAIESGLVKIPQLAVRDSTGKDIPGYFNIWRFIWDKLTPAEKGGAHASPRPEAILKWANTPISMLASHWDEMRKEWATHKDDPRPPVFILVCKNTRIAKVLYEWLAEDKAPADIPQCKIAAFRNTADRINTIRVDSRVVQETDSAEAKSDESAWMRLTLDTVGKVKWPEDRQGRTLYPEGFEELARKLGRPLHPPGRDLRCIVSVGMLTEGWDCNTVTHIIGLRPFMSQLLCEQVVGRGLRRASYEVGEGDLLSEEVSKVFGVPFEVIPFKASPDGAPPPPVKRAHVHALPEKAALEIQFPRVIGYRQAIRNRITVNWDSIAQVTLDPLKIPPEVEVKAALPNNTGRPSLNGPGKLESIDLQAFRKGRRQQELAFELARDLTRDYLKQAGPHPPAHVLFPQVAAVVQRYLEEKVVATAAGGCPGHLPLPLLRLGHRTAGGSHQAGLQQGRGAGGSRAGSQPGTGLHRGRGFLDQQGCAGSDEEPPQLRRGGHQGVGAGSGIHHRQASRGDIVCQERRVGLFHPIPAQRPAPRIRSRFHHQARRGTPQVPGAGNQGIR